MNVLIVEDDDNLRAALARCASRYEYKAYEASDPTTAMELILSHRFHLLIADWDLGQALTGVDIARCACNHSPDTRIVMISGKPMSALRIAASDLTVHVFLTKPFGLREMSDIFKAMNS